MDNRKWKLLKKKKYGELSHSAYRIYIILKKSFEDFQDMKSLTQV